MRFDYDVEKDSDQNLLFSFFRSLRRGFEELIFENRWGDRAVAFYGNGQTYLQGALDETGEQFQQAYLAVERVQSESLAKVGLSGQSLRAKLYYIKFWADRALRGIRGAIGKTLDNINIVLGSFYAATGVGEAIRELKDVIKNNLATA